MSGPGISHSGTIHNKKRNNIPWQELSGKIKEVRQERRKQKRLRVNK